MNRVLALLGCLVLVLSGCSGNRSSGAITVFAPSSAKAAFEEVATAFTAQTGTEVRFSFLGSQDLVANLAGGAAADVLATADERTMGRAVEQQLVGTPTDFAANTLVLVTAPGNPAGITGLDRSLDGRRLVICDEAVPCGNATATLAQRLGISLAPVSKEQKVSDVLAKVTTGEADAGVVYGTDARTAGDRVTTIQVPGADQVVNNYPIAVTADPHDRAAAQAFVDFVQGPTGRQILTAHGFRDPRG